MNHVLGQCPANDKGSRHAELAQARLLDLANVATGDTLAGLDDDFALRRLDVEVELQPAQARGNKVEPELGLVEVEGVHLEEGRENLLAVHAERAQQDRGRQLAPAIDTHVQVILGVELEVEPRAAVRNHARGKQQLARGVGFAEVVLEKHARGTVQLRDDDALGAVNNKSAVVGHERNLAHVDFLLLDITHGLGAGALVLVEHHQAQQHAQRRGVDQAALLAFLDVETRRAEAIADELERGVAVVRLDREHRFERRLQALVDALLRRHLRLQKLPVRLLLDLQQVRRLQDARALAKALADEFLFGE